MIQIRHSTENDSQSVPDTRSAKFFFQTKVPAQMDKKMTRIFLPFYCDIVEDADAGIDSDATVKLATSTHKSSPLAPTTQRGDFLKQPNKKSEKCRPYTRSQQRDNETKFNMEERWRVHDNIIEKLRKQQIGKSPEQIIAELKCHQLHMKELQRRIAEKLARKIMDPKINLPHKQVNNRRGEKVLRNQR